jgi:hypothetical protein
MSVSTAIKPLMENEKESGRQGAHWSTCVASCDGHTSLDCWQPSILNQGGKMSRIIIIMSQTIFFRLLAHAPEDLQQETKEDARRAIPAFCLTEDDIREKFAQEEEWEEMSEESQKMAIQSLMDASEYDHAARLANEAITEAVGRYLHDAMIEKERQQEENNPA